MAEEFDQDRTEAPTPRRRQEAREEGNVARSTDLSAALLLVGLLVALWALGPRMLDSWRQMTLLLFAPEEIARHTTADLPRTLWQVGQHLAAGLVPLFVTVILVGVLANLGQVGFLYAPKKLTPRPGALNPIKGFSRIFGSAKTYVGLLMNLGKMVLVAAVAWFAVKGELPRMISLQAMEFAPAVGLGSWIVFTIGLKIALVLLVLAIADYGWQRYSHEQQLKMTRQQVKDEMKRMEGDPQIKARRRQIALQRATQRDQANVPTADVIVTNPTHCAVAIRYEKGTMRAPRVVAKGADLLAMRIRELAGLHGVAIVERPPLARALYQSVEVGKEIPEDFYTAVAELLAYVYQLDRAATPI